MSKETVITPVKEETNTATNEIYLHERGQLSAQGEEKFGKAQDEIWDALWPYEYCSLHRLAETPHVRRIGNLGKCIADPNSNVPTAVIGGEMYAYMPMVVELLYSTLVQEEQASSSKNRE